MGGEAVGSAFVKTLDWPSIQLTLDDGLSGLSIFKENYEISMSLDLERVTMAKRMVDANLCFALVIDSKTEIMLLAGYTLKFCCAGNDYVLTSSVHIQYSV